MSYQFDLVRDRPVLSTPKPGCVSGKEYDPSMTNERENEVKLVAVFRLDDDMEGPSAETPWGEPVNADEGGGTYRVLNDCVFAPLRYGDIVRAQLDGDSRLQIVGIESLAEGVWSRFETPDSADQSTINDVAQRFNNFGVTSISGGMGVLVACWMPELTVQQVAEACAVVLPQDWPDPHIVGSGERMTLLRETLQFEIDESTSTPEQVNYWTADDPAWADLGVTDPDMLAYLQTLAAGHPGVLATIRAGQHANVLTFVARLNAPNPAALPPLDGPLLVNPEMG